MLGFKLNHVSKRGHRNHCNSFRDQLPAAEVLSFFQSNKIITTNRLNNRAQSSIKINGCHGDMPYYSEWMQLFRACLLVINGIEVILAQRCI